MSVELFFEGTNTSLQGFNERAGFVFAGGGYGEVLWPIVVADAIDMMNDFIIAQCAPKLTLNDQAVFPDLLADSSVYIDVSLADNMSPTAPSRMFCAAFGRVIFAPSQSNTNTPQPGRNSILCHADRFGDSLACLAGFVHCDKRFDGRKTEPATAVSGLHVSQLQPAPDSALVHAEMIGDLISCQTTPIHISDSTGQDIWSLYTDSGYVAHTRDCITSMVN